MTAAEIRKKNEELKRKAQAQAQISNINTSTGAVTGATTGAATTPVKATNKAAQAQAAVQNMATPNIYQQTLAAADPTFSTVNYDNVLKRGVDEGFRVANDEDRALWQQVIAAQNAGDTAAVTSLLNSMRAQGNFSGYYGDDGLYYGFARGYGGAAGNSYQPVIGGKLIASGNTDTDQWLTPDGKAYSGNLGGSLSSAGVWSYGDPKQMASVPSTKNYGTTKVPSGNGVDSAPASYSPEGGKIAQTIQPVESTPQSPGISFSDGVSADGTPTGSNPYIQAMDEASAPMVTPQAATSQAPAWEGGDFDWRDTPEYKEFVDKYSNAESPAWEDEFDWTQSPEYIAFMEKYGNAEAPEYEGSQYDPMRDAALEKAKNPFSYDLERDPAWQAYQKQYRREGQRAYQDTLANAAARTGGKASSYAVTAANQAGNYYKSQMTDKIPQLYQDAYNRYLNEYQKQMGIASQYNQLGQQDYAQYLDRRAQWNTDRDLAYGQAQDAIGNYRKDYDTRYQQYLDDLERFYTDRGFSYDQAQEAIANARKDYDTQYQQHLDELEQFYTDRDYQHQLDREAVEDERYEQERMQKLREYADAQNWKEREFQQYLKEHDEELSWREKEYIYQLMRDSVADERYEDETAYAKEQDALKLQRQARIDAMNEADWKAGYGDTSGAEALGVDTGDLSGKVYAYAPDGSTYDIGSSKGQYFLQYAGPGQTMTGGDGSTWTKNEDGTVTISKGGKTFTYGTPMAEETPAASGGYKGTGSVTPKTEEGIYEAMIAAGIKTEGDAYAYLLQQGYNTTQAGKLSKYFAESLGGDQGSKYSDDDLNRAWNLVSDKNANPTLRAWAEQVLSDTYGMRFGDEASGTAGTGNQSLEYGDIDRAMQNMANRGASWDEIRTELQAALRDKQITQAEYDALAEKYHGQSDNVRNGSQKHADGRPQSAAFNSVFRQASTYNDRGDRDKVLDILWDALEQGIIHEYEIDLIKKQLRL